MGSDPDWHHRLDGSRDEAGSGVWGSVREKWYFLAANLEHTIVTIGDFTAYVCAAMRRFSQITLGKLVIVVVMSVEGEEAMSESAMELMLEAFEMQCRANLQQAIRTVDGLGIEYDENVVCDVCRSVC